MLRSLTMDRGQGGVSSPLGPGGTPPAGGTLGGRSRGSCWNRARTRDAADPRGRAPALLGRAAPRGPCPGPARRRRRRPAPPRHPSALGILHDRLESLTDTPEHRAIAGLLLFAQGRVAGCAATCVSHRRAIVADRGLRDQTIDDTGQAFTRRRTGRAWSSLGQRPGARPTALTARSARPGRSRSFTVSCRPLSYRPRRSSSTSDPIARSATDSCDISRSSLLVLEDGSPGASQVNPPALRTMGLLPASLRVSGGRPHVH